VVYWERIAHPVHTVVELWITECQRWFWPRRRGRLDMNTCE